MLSTGQAAADTIDFLVKHGFCPEKVAEAPLCPTIMLARVIGKATDEETLKTLTNLDILSGGSLRPDKRKVVVERVGSFKFSDNEYLEMWLGYVECNGIGYRQLYVTAFDKLRAHMDDKQIKRAEKVLRDHDQSGASDAAGTT